MYLNILYFSPISKFPLLSVVDCSDLFIQNFSKAYNFILTEKKCEKKTIFCPGLLLLWQPDAGVILEVGIAQAASNKLKRSTANNTEIIRKMTLFPTLLPEKQNTIYD